jgi:nicotinamide-nucleotide amidase
VPDLVHVAVVAVGDELLLGDVVNGNLAWLGRALADAGTPVVRGYEVGDAIADIVATLRSALAVADAVVVTGGLGPTSDDRTRDALAELAGVPLVRDPALEQVIGGWYERLGRTAPDNVWQQADVPVGALPIPNPTGTAPGLALEVDGRPVFALPGVPGELRGMVTATVVPALRERAGDPPPVVTRQLRVALLGESLVAAQLAPLEAELAERAEHGDAVPVALSYLGSPGEVRVRFSGNAPALLDELAERAEDLLGDVVSGRDGETLPATVLRLLVEQGATVAVAESLTGGALASALVDVAGASLAFRGAVVAYSTELKAALLGVDADLLARGGPVQAEVAVAMAAGVRTRLGADFGIGTTGVAGPDPQAGVAPGTVHVAVVGPGPGDVRAVELQVPGDRDRVRRLAVVHGLDLLRRGLLPREQPV